MFDKKAYNNEYSKKHHKEYLERNAEKYFVEIECSICKGHYKKINEKKHLKTKKHILAELLKKNNEQNVDAL